MNMSIVKYIGEPLYRFAGNSNYGHFKYLGTVLSTVKPEDWFPITEKEAGITERTHRFSKDWNTGNIDLLGPKNEYGGKHGYALIINSHSQFFRNGDNIYYAGGFTIL